MPLDSLPQSDTAIHYGDPFRVVIFDIETNGLLPAHREAPFCMDRIHSLSIRCVNTGQKRSYVNEDLLPMSSADLEELEALGITDVRPLREGLKLLLLAEVLIGHNIIDFDIPAIQLIYPDWQPDGRLIDSLVMARMVFADVKEGDFRMLAKGQLEGRLLGQQGLEAWGQRLGLHKGDYSKERKQTLIDLHKEEGRPAPTDEEIHAFVWGVWTPAMHDYMILDVDVNAMLWDKIAAENWPDRAVKLEHHIHALMVTQERNGFLFDVAKAEKLADNLRTEYDKLSGEAVNEIGKWFRPARVVTDKVDESQGEDDSRRTWGECTYPKRTMNRAKSRETLIARGQMDKIQPSTEEGAALVKVELKEFNPNSRPQIIDRLKTLWGWEPQDFTEKGGAKVDDEILRALSDDIPLAETLAEVFYIKKRLGQVADGKNGWLKLLRPDGRIHGRVNVGGAVSGRATHASPNMSQVTGVNPVEFSTKDGADPKIAYEAGLAFIAQHEEQYDDWGRSLVISKKWSDKKGEWTIYTRGRTGGYGWDCRELFMAPKGYKLVGTDLSGVEFRCLANLTFPFDDGEIRDLVLNGDIHQHNADLAGISRSVAKRLLYACMYGGGDAKLGSIVEPFASEARQRTLGKQLREKLMRAMPSLKAALRAIHKEMRTNKGRIRGLDGRWLYARSKHSALNLRLQSDGALIAKKWCLLQDDAFYAEGWDHGVGLEYAFNSWSHDETQISVRDDLALRAAEITEATAPLAGEYFNFMCPITAQATIGNHWAETH